MFAPIILYSFTIRPIAVAAFAIAVVLIPTLTYSQIQTNAGVEMAIMPYKTTMMANGKDRAVLVVRLVDKQGNDLALGTNLIEFSVSGDAKFIKFGNEDAGTKDSDQYEPGKWQQRMFNGLCKIVLQSGTSPGIVKVEARSQGLEKASTEIHTIRPFIQPVVPGFTMPVRKMKDRMLGADISFLPQLEDRGIRFHDNGVEKDAIEILKDHGFNYVRLRIFHNPATEKGYSPKKGFCDLDHTRQMAIRAKKAGMKVLLDFHYSDYWADPQQQFKPLAWEGLSFSELLRAVRKYTRDVLTSLKEAGALPDMVQVGNEINHGMIWPDGHIGRIDSLAQLIKAGIEGTREVDSSVWIMLHIALGGQNEEARFWLDNMLTRGVEFDLIGLSYYPRWHGSLKDLKNNLNDLARRYPHDLDVVEYSHLKKEVNDMVFSLPGGRGVGTCIWEPLNTWESIFDKNGNSNELLSVYDGLAKLYMRPK